MMRTRYMITAFAVLALISRAAGNSVSRAVADDEPLFPFEEKTGFGFVDITGKVVITPQYDNCYYPFSEGLAAVQVGRKWGYINRDNRMVIPPQFDSAQPFSNGMAAVRIGEPFVGQGKYGYIGKTGQFVLPPDDKFSYGGFHEGRMKVRIGEKWGFVDEQGKPVIPSVFDDATQFSEGLAAVQKGDQHGFIDRHGKWTIRLTDACPASVCWFSSGLAPVLDLKSRMYGYIDKTGNFAIKPQYHSACSFSEERAGVCIREEDEDGWPVAKWGYIDPAGKVAVPFKYDFRFSAFSFSDGLAKVYRGKKVGFVNRIGKEVIPCQLFGAEPFKNGLAKVTVGDYGSETGWWGYVDKTGNFVWRPSDYAKRDKARLAKEEQEPSIRLITDPESKEKGLVVTCHDKVYAKGKNAGLVWIAVANSLEEEVFLEVTDFELGGYDIESKDGSWCSAMGVQMIGFPDNTRLLKRLHASSYNGGSRLTCGCAVTRLKGTLGADVLDKAPARGTVTVWLSGHYRNNGKRFSEFAKVSIKIVDAAEEPVAPKEEKEQRGEQHIDSRYQDRSRRKR